MSSCIVSTVSNPTEGCIVPKVSGGSLNLLNSTFVRCSKTIGSKINHTTTEDILVDNCLTTSYASCIHPCQGNGPLTIQNNNMTNCESKWGGGCFHIHTGFSNADLISDCTFSNCYTTETSTQCNGGGAVWNGEGAKVSYSNVAFENCCANATYGGAISFASRETAYTHYSSLFYCLFIECDAFGDGKDIYAANPWQNILNESQFVLCCTNKHLEANRLVFAEKGDKSSWIGNLGNIYADVHGTDTLGCGWAKFPCLTIFNSVEIAVVASKGSPVFINIAAGSYVERALAIDSKCLSFEGSSNFGTELSASSSNSKALFQISTGCATLFDLFIIRNSSASTFLPLFSVSSASGELVLSSCKISSEPSQITPFATAFASISAGHLNMSKTTVESMMFSDVSALRIESSTLHCFTFENTTFRGITRNEGSGSVFDVTLTSGDELNLNDLNFERCACSKGNGGSLNCILEAGGKVTIGSTKRIEMEGCTVPQDRINKGKGGGIHLQLTGSSSDFAIQETSFYGCAAWKGNNVFVDAISLSSTITRGTFRFTQTGMSDDDLMGFEDQCRTDPVPLLAYLQAFTGTAVVGGSKSRDFSGCGTANYPCGSIEYAATLRFPRSKRVVALNQNFEWTEVLVFDVYEWEVKSPTRGQETKVSSEGTSTAEGMVTVEIESLIANLTFSAADQLGRHSCFILCQCGELSMADCSLKCSSSGSAEFGFGFIKISGGSLLLNRFSTASQVTFCSASLITLDGSGGFSCSECNMSSIKRTSGNGGCILIAKNNLLASNRNREIAIDGCSFSDCCVCEEEGEGGGVSAWLGENDIMIVNGSSCFEECLAQSEEGSGGKGGGMCIRCGDESSSFEIQNGVEFSKVKGNKAEFGKDVFVGCERGFLLSQMINSSSFGFFDSSESPSDALALSGSENGNSFPIIPLHVYLCSLQSEIITGSDNGADHTRCGFPSFACLSIDYCVENRISDSLNNIKVVSRSIIQQENSISLTPVNIYSEALVPVSVKDTGGATQDGLVMCSSALFLVNLLLNVQRTFLATRKAFLFSSSSLSISNCWLEYSSENVNEPVSFCVIYVNSGDLMLSGFKMEVDVTFTFSPICAWNYNAITIENSNITGTRKINGDGGCLYIHEVNGNERSITLQRCKFSGSCNEENGIRGGGIMGNVGSGNTLSVKSTTFENCMVPSDGNENGGKGLGGGMYLCLNKNVKSLAFDNISFSGCNAWKGKQLFVGGEDLSQIVGDWLECFKTETILAEDMMGLERSTTNREFHIPLVLYFRAFMEPCFIGGAEGNGFDHTGCGFSDYPCGTLPYGGFVRFGDSKAHLRLTDHFCFADAIVLSSQEMDIEAEANGTLINVMPDGTGEGEGLVETNNVVSFSGITFNVSTTFAAEERKCLFLCSGSALSLVDCSVSAQSKKIGFGYVIVRGGSLHVLRGVLNEIELLGAPVVELSGKSSRCTLEDLEWNNLKTGSVEGLIASKSSSHVEMKNSKVSGPTQFGNHGVFFVEELSCATVEKSNFSLLTRNEGNGVVVTGRVGSGKSLNVNSCSFTSISCLASGSKGGSIITTLSANGELLFNNNTVEESKVKKADGLGGGMHIEFLSSEVGYSMKNNKFLSNDAMLGYDVYLVCPAPRMMIDRNKWAGSATEEQEEKTMWVIDPLFPEGSDTLLKYLFPSSDEIIYVNTFNGHADGCGAEDYPCEELWYASGKMTEEKRILRVLSSCELRGAIEKENVPITIEGKGKDRSRVIVGKEGHLKMAVGAALTTLTISRIGFELPQISDFSELVEVGVGTTYFVECTFGSTDPEACAETSMRIITGRGGRISLDGVNIKNMKYKADCGIFLSGEVVCTFDNAEVSNIRSSGKGMVVGEGRTEIFLNVLRSTNCSFGKGGFVVLKKVKTLNWKNGTSITNSRNEGGNGGCGFISVEGECDAQINGTSICLCSANEDHGRGGGLYLDISKNPLLNIQLSEITFAGNCAFEGKDIFVLSTDVNASVVRERFMFQLQNERNESTVDLKGTDDALLGGSVVDLLLFLIQRKESSIAVSKSGMDILGCGSAEFPCLSFWRGYENIDLEAHDRVIRIDSRGNIRNHYDLSSFKVMSNKADEKCVVLFENALEGGEEKSVIRNTKELKLELVQLSLPSSFTNNEKVLLHSSSADSCLSLNGCTFKCSSASDLEFCLIRSEAGDVQLLNCDFSSLSFSSTPVQLNSSCEIIGCNFSSISAKSSQKGGAVCVELVGEATFSMSQTETVGCGCSEEHGRGGFVFVECQGASMSNPFVFGEDVSFAGHKAQRGKNVFISAGDLNKSVTLSSFCFDFRKSREDELLFCGRDFVWEDTTLLRFLETFTNQTIFVGSGGYDVMRCGSKEDPCRSMWKGMRQIDEGAPQKWIKIADETTVQDSFVLSNFTIECDETEEQSRGKLIFSSQTADRNDAGISSEGTVQLNRISVVMSEGFYNERLFCIVGKSGQIGMSDCSLAAETREAVPAKVGFLVMESGVLNATKLTVENVISEICVLAINSRCVCVLQQVMASKCTLSGESFAKIVSSGNEKENEVESSVSIKDSTFQLITRNDNGPAIISSSGCAAVLSLSGCTFDSCKAVCSEKGGGVFEELESGGALSMIKSSVIQCGCDNDNGKGGGIYICSNSGGALSFLFEKMTFKGNSAKVGNDIFVECIDIESQINETQFRFDLRETAYARLNAIYGIDATNHKSDTNLMDFITIHQADTIILSSDPSKNGKNERQCGTLKLPCLTVDYGLEHLTSDVESRLLVDVETLVEKEMDLEDLSMASRKDHASKVTIFRDIPQTRACVISMVGSVSILKIEFSFEVGFSSAHRSLFSIESGNMSFQLCSFTQLQEEGNIQSVGLTLISVENGNVRIEKTSIRGISLSGESAIRIMHSEGRVALSEMEVRNVDLSKGVFILIEGKASLDKQARNGEEKSVDMKSVEFGNVSSGNAEKGVYACSLFEGEIYLANCSFWKTSSRAERGSVMSVERCSNVTLEWNKLQGETGQTKKEKSRKTEELCNWNGSLIDMQKSRVVMKETTIANSSEGGASIEGGSVVIEKGEFANNNPMITGYESARRNVVCQGMGKMDFMSVKGGEGQEKNGSLWILNKGCTLSGIAEERRSPLFIPSLESVITEDEGTELKVLFKGQLLLPCNLSFRASTTIASKVLVEQYEFSVEGLVSEGEAWGKIPSKSVREAEEESEVNVSILFGDKDAPLSTEAITLKNKSKVQTAEDGNAVEASHKTELSWAVMGLIILAVIFLIFLIAFSAIVIMLRKKLKEIEKNVEKGRSENEHMTENPEMKSENFGGSFEMSEMPSTLLEGMTSQIPLLIDNDEEDLPEPPSMTDEDLNENDLPDLESQLPFSEDTSVSLVSQSHSFNVISAKKPFREKEKKNIKTLHSVIHSVQGNFTLGTRAINVVDGKEVVMAVAKLFEHLISVRDERVEMMVRQLCPYSIFVEEGNENEIYVLTEESKDEKQKEEMKRWKAPEVGNEDEEIEKAVVFTLGLILHEMTTGEVPLSECDAEEAQEMMRDGVRPLTEGIEEEEMVELMEQMWADEPNDRPKLTEVIQLLKELFEKKEE
ncbi:putative Protein tyrosine and serine/threonine kinase [Monocercomonoides exilis]|uniref:putative Protein tyrosine and serine/threonine kinase n=1 Tax=Monocercomonoides exilis TaxID=2049356 RepID=UPI00355A5733|nr:putative Protein tyrosine and serine/threonine kinase [Monocercomonoides exilis]|eukprot:MONOS_1060.1-p1 / transcript=MONOS_1060.1 / gene=MONOS_1060 / organism=Monocercomonoides_exilis_PA203 / gene_product=unspecified product / transcript_product=unspecified product / location=Mono_scaffold00018:44656-55557(-) / protein_length=3581 / sequence_SO=supercontig / SO=protein_coding / is_pseudo=false